MKRRSPTVRWLLNALDVTIFIFCAAHASHYKKLDASSFFFLRIHRQRFAFKAYKNGHRAIADLG